MSNSNQTSLHLPLLDISQPLLPSTLSSISQACKEWGFFNITNHGIPKHLHQKLHILSTQLFKLPSHTKLKLGPSSSISTYTPPFIASPFFESLCVSGPDFHASSASSFGILFEQPNTEFCDMLQEYGDRMMDLSRRIVALLLKCLGDVVEENYYQSEFSRCHGYLRINSYTTTDDAELDEVEGLGMHTDMSCITILYIDDVGRLQVRSKEGKWMDVVPGEGTMVVNIGDLMQAWSNGRLRSSQHRVVLPRSICRLSMAFFWCFEDEKVVLAPEDVVEEGKERIYKPFVCRDYIKYRENSEIGRFDKVGYTIDDFDTTTSTTVPKK